MGREFLESGIIRALSGASQPVGEAGEERAVAGDQAGGEVGEGGKAGQVKVQPEGLREGGGETAEHGFGAVG